MLPHLLLLLTLAQSPAQPLLPPPTGDSIVDPDARLELLYTRVAPIHGGLTEGPATAPLFHPGNLTSRYQSVNVSVQKRIRYIG